MNKNYKFAKKRTFLFIVNFFIYTPKKYDLELFFYCKM